MLKQPRHRVANVNPASDNLAAQSFSRGEDVAANFPELAIKPERLQADLKALERFTDPDLPWTRRAFSQQYAEARSWLAQRMREAGLDVHVDAAANLIGRRGGKGNRVLMIGSHTDTVEAGGRFDGIVGVLGALEVARCLEEANLELSFPLEVVDFLCEEPTVLNLSPLGSRIMAGNVTQEHVEAVQAPFGGSLPEAIDALGGDAKHLDRARRDLGEITAYLELHIEQGAVLEREGLAVGVVTSIAAPCRARVTFTGVADHAGATPMPERYDALAGAAELVLTVERIASAPGMVEEGVGTVGWLSVSPNMVNVIPGRVDLTVEVRSTDREALVIARREVDEEIRAIADRRRLDHTIAWQHLEQPVEVPVRMQECVASACDALGLAYQHLPSRASHDAARLSGITPVGMVFIRCKDGKSHCPEEWAELEDIVTGTRVLGQSLLRVNAMLRGA